MFIICGINWISFMVVGWGNPSFATLPPLSGLSWTWICQEQEPSRDVPALVAAAAQNQQERVQALLSSGANWDARDPVTGWTALHWAIQHGNYDLAVLLLDAGCDVDSLDGLGKTPLYLAASLGDWEMTRWLQQQGASLNRPDQNQFTPLHAAIQNRHEQVAIRMLDAGADPNAATTGGITPMLLAESLKLTEVVSRLKAADVETVQLPPRRLPPLPKVDVRKFIPRIPPETSESGGNPTETAPAPPNVMVGPEGIAKPETAIPADSVGAANTVSPPPINPEATRALRASAIADPDSWLGLTTMSSTSEVLRMLRLKGSISLISLADNGIAWRVGLRQGDMISHCDDRVVKDEAAFTAMMAEAIRSDRAFLSLNVIRPEEGISLTVDLPLPRFGSVYRPVTQHWEMPIPDGWFLLSSARNRIPDPEFDSLITRNGDQILLLSKNGFPAPDPQRDLGDYRQQTVTDSQQALDPGVESLTIAGLPAFRVFYRLPDNPATSLSRMAFVHRGRRYVINAVRYQVEQTQLSPEAERAIRLLQAK